MSDPKRIVVIGGLAAGPKAAARARRLDQTAEIIILQKESDLSMASCGYPYYVGGVFDDRNHMLSTPAGVVRDSQFFHNVKRIDARVNTEAIAIDKENKIVTYKDLKTDEVGELKYDKLIITTGSVPRMAPIPGIKLEGVRTLQSMKDSDYLRAICDEMELENAVIVGGGLIGLETCEALRSSDIKVTIIELLPQILTFLDWELAKIIENHLVDKSCRVITECGVTEFLGLDGKLTGVKLQDGTEIDCELAVVAIGVVPNSKLARDAGLKVGAMGGIEVNEYMQTSDPDIYAAGDCVETTSIITGKKTYAPFGDLANLQGRVAGENVISGNRAAFPGTIHSGICKIFDFSAGSTGFSERIARKMGYDNIITAVNASPDKPGFMRAGTLVTKAVVDKSSGRILGAQCIGTGDVCKQLAQWALAIQGNMTIADLINVDLPYAPPFSLAIDHFITVIHILQNKLEGRMTGISPVEVQRKLDAKEQPFLLDVRDDNEFKNSAIGIGEHSIPLGTLRDRLNELPEDRDQEIICCCALGLRGYETTLILRAKGWTDVKVMEGGVLAWPYIHLPRP